MFFVFEFIGNTLHTARHEAKNLTVCYEKIGEHFQIKKRMIPVKRSGIFARVKCPWLPQTVKNRSRRAFNEEGVRMANT